MAGDHAAASGEGWLEELDESECRELLTHAAIGRLIWTGDEGLSATPVNYTLDGQDIVVRLSPYSMVAREADRSAVAFEVDEIDTANRRGWSVLARGWATRDTRSEPHHDSDVWPAGQRNLALRLEVRHLTGRRLDASSGTRR